MNLTIIRKSIGGNKFQKTLSLLTIILATLLLSAMLNITLGIGNEVARELRSYGSNIVVLPKGASLGVEIGDEIYSPLLNDSFLEESKLHLIKEIFWRNNITAIAPFLDSQVKVFKGDSATGDSFEVLASGTYFDKNLGVQDEPDFTSGVKALYPFWQIKGEWTPDDSLDQVMIGSTLAKDRNLQVGDTLVLQTKEGEAKVKISGIVEHGGSFESKIITSLALMQKLMNKPNAFFKAEVSAFTIPENDLSYKARQNVDSLDQVEFDKWYCSAFVSSIAYQIEEDFKGASAKAQTQVSDAESAIVSKIQSLMGIVSFICLIVASIGIGALLSADLQRRMKEIALMKVLGATLWQIYFIFAMEACVIAVIGAVIGFGCGVVVSQMIAWGIFGHFLPVSWLALPLCIAFALLISLCGSLFLIKGIVQLLPARVLYGK